MIGRRLAVLTVLWSLAFGIQTYAGTWEKQNGLWYYDNGDGTRPSDEWRWIDGNGDGIAECYYFDRNGYMYSGEGTPDGYWVNEQGAWTENGIVQYREIPDGNYGESGLLDMLSVITRNNRETNRNQFPVEKEFTRFDTVSGNVAIYYDDDGNFVYLTKHCKDDVLPPIKNLNMKLDTAQEVSMQLSGLGYHVEQIQYYKTRVHLPDGFYADYKADTKFLIVGKEADLQ